MFTGAGNGMWLCRQFSFSGRRMDRLSPYMMILTLETFNSRLPVRYTLVTNE